MREPKHRPATYAPPEAIKRTFKVLKPFNNFIAGDTFETIYQYKGLIYKKGQKTHITSFNLDTSDMVEEVDNESHKPLIEDTNNAKPTDK